MVEQPAPTGIFRMPIPRCDTEGVSALPFITWSGDVPLLGRPLQGLLQGIAHATGALLLARTGEQFFMLDGSGEAAASGGAGNSGIAVHEVGGGHGAAAAASRPGEEAQPLLFQVRVRCPQLRWASRTVVAVAMQLVCMHAHLQPCLTLHLQMTQDVPDKGLYFFSALGAFKTRTAFANTDGAHTTAQQQRHPIRARGLCSTTSGCYIATPLCSPAAALLIHVLSSPGHPPAGDHLVGWANSSLRPLAGLPPLPSAKVAEARGVVLEDPLSAALYPADSQQIHRYFEKV